MGECKTKAIQTNLGIFTHIPGIFRHIQTYSEIHAYFEPCGTLSSIVQGINFLMEVLFSLQELLFNVKKYEGQGQRARDHEF